MASDINFESLAMSFLTMIDDRFSSSERVLNGISTLLANHVDTPINILRKKIILLNVLRDAVKEVSPNHIFRSLQHRDDLYAAIIEALEELEDKLQELEEQELSEEEAK